ncbi:FecR protein [Pedobacter steynii]|uniref:FecR protein n=1 Tax=Pedobacter steynii TaxID=430522 RepID=A0A1G9P6Z7_9SPHI|nr:FecR family protein [Pedobacter steynii]NQX39088.1 FecR domain-containing protein [Pedobacter steynii]SDL94007.1 FecR protein [Pedobacter steynii]
MDHNNKRLSELFNGYLSQINTDEERIEFFDYVQDPFYAVDIQELISDAYENQVEPVNIDARIKAEVLNSILAEKQFINTPKRIKLWPGIAAAVAIITVVGLGLLFYNDKAVEQSVVTNQANDASPGKNTATLTLADGRKIMLSNVKNGQLANESGSIISKTVDGQLVYQDGKMISDEKVSPNVLSTTRGQTYKVQLPDGTNVWLNSASSIKYPASFANLKDRTVELTGEAYFEVAKEKNHPFIVRTDRQEVRVLGTHFNINSYKDEPAIVTTLLEGSIRINNVKTLKPGEQADLDKSGELIVSQGNSDAAAWKDGKFRFLNTDLETVLRQLGRWYDVEIKYEDAIPQRKFTGGIDRSLKASEALDILRYTKVNFRIEGKTIIVSNK